MRKPILYILITIFSFITPSLFAQQQDNLDEFKNDFVKASAVTDDEKRLQEYDKIAFKYKIKKKDQVLDTWVESVDINPLDDSRRVIFQVISSDFNARLFIRKSLGKKELYITCDNYLGIDGTNITYRVGKAEAQNDTWSISSDTKGAFFKGDVDAIILQMADSEKFVAQVVPFNENPITAVFDIRGLKQLLIKYKDDFGYEEELKEAENIK